MLYTQSMKLLLTSGGLTNSLIIDALADLVGKDFRDTSVAFIPTASNVESGDKWWVIKDLVSLSDLKCKSVDIVDISAFSKDIALSRLKEADVLFFEGGGTFYLMRAINKIDLQKEILGSLEDKVWVGISAGSMVTGPDLALPLSQKLYEEDLQETEEMQGLSLTDFYVLPHLNSEWFKSLTEENIRREAKDITRKLYALDDNCAIKVVDDVEEVVGNGKWFVINE